MVFPRSLARWLGQDDEPLLVRISLLVLLGFVFLADSFGMEAVVGAYAAGMAVAVFFSGCGGRALGKPLTSIGSSFLHPAVLYRGAAWRSICRRWRRVPGIIGRLLLFTLAFLLIRIAPLGIYKNAACEKRSARSRGSSSTTLPLVVAIPILAPKPAR